MTDNRIDILTKVIELTENYHFSVKRNIYRETLKQLLHIFGNVYYLNGDGTRTKVKCTTGKPDRTTGKDANENNLVLPYITVVETGSEEADDRRKVHNLLVNEKIWDEKENRAKRYLSLAPKAININYEINIWAKFNADLDQIRYSVFSLFHPSLDIRTNFSDYTKAFVKSESDINSQQAGDTTDRLVQKTISITVETYLPSPKFLFTNTGEIKSFNAEVTLADTRQSVTEEIQQKNIVTIIEGETGSGGGGGGGGITGPLTLSGSLDDVSISSVTLGDALIWDGSYWVPSSIPVGGGGESYFSALLDVNVTGNYPLSGGAILYYNSSIDKWTNTIPPDLNNQNSQFIFLRLDRNSGEAQWYDPRLHDISDVTSIPANTGDVLYRYNNIWGYKSGALFKGIDALFPYANGELSGDELTVESGAGGFGVSVSSPDNSILPSGLITEENGQFLLLSVVPSAINDKLYLSSLADTSIVAPNEGYLLAWDGNTWVASALGAQDTPGGENYAIQFRYNNSFSGSPSLIWDTNSNGLSGTNAIIQNVSASIVSATEYKNLPVSSHSQLLNLSANDHPQYVISSTNQNLSSLVSNIETSTVGLSSVLGSHIGSAVHWDLATLNTNYINASGDSANAGFFFSSISGTLLSLSSSITNSIPLLITSTSSVSAPLIFFSADSGGNVTEAARINFKGIGNLFFGRRSGTALTTGSYNTGIGQDALLFLTNGAYNTAVGEQASERTTGSFNTSLGYFAGYNQNTGSRNTSIGSEANAYVSTGSDNTAVGQQANYTGAASFNVAVGSQAMRGNAIGPGNTAIGYQSFYRNPSGTGNIGLGYRAGYGFSSTAGGVSSTNNIVIGYDSNITEPILFSNTIVIGSGTTSTASNQTIIGHPSTSATIIRGTLSASSISGINISGTIVSATTVSAGTLNIGGSDGYIINNNGSIIVSALNGTVKFPQGFEVTGALSGPTVSATTYLNLPTSSLSGLADTQITNPSQGQSLVWNGTKWAPSSVAGGGGGGGEPSDHGGLLGLEDNDHPQYVLSSTNQTLSSTVSDHIASASVHFTSGSLSSYYAASSWVNSNYSLTSHSHSFSALSGLSDTQITSPATSSVLKWNGTKWVPAPDQDTDTGILNGFSIIYDPFDNPVTATGEDSIKFVSRDNAIAISVDVTATPQEVNFEVNDGGITHNNLAGLTTGNPHTQYLLTASSSLSSLNFLSLSATTISATTYRNLPSGTATWNASAIQGVSVTSTSPTTGQTLIYNGTNWAPSSLSSTSITTNEVQSIWIPAVAMYTPSSTTDGAEAVTTETSNGIVLRTLDFDPATVQYAQFSIKMPRSWNEGTINYNVVWQHPTTTVSFGVVWRLDAQSVTDTDSLNTAWSTGTTVTDTGLTTLVAYHSPDSAAMTISGSPAPDDLILFRVVRVATDGSDTLGVDASLIGVQIKYTINTSTDL